MILLASTCLVNAQSLQDTVHLKFLIDKAGYHSDRDFDSSYWYNKKAMTLAKRIGDALWLGHAHNTYGDYFLMQTEIDSGIFYYKKAREYFEEADHIWGILDTMNGIGSMLYNSGNYRKALNYLIEALSILQTNNYPFNQLEAALLINIAQVYQNLKDYAKSNEYNQQSLVLLEDLGNTVGIASAKGNMAFNFIELQNYEAAMKMALEAKELFEDVDILMGIGASNYVIGKCYRNLNQFAKAESYLNQALDQLREFGDPYLTTLTLIDLGKLYNGLNRFQLANKNLSEALRLAKAYTLKPELVDIYEQLAIYSEGIGNYQKALIFERKHKDIADSLFNEEISAQMADMESKYQSEQKEQQISLQDQQIKANEARLAREATFRNALIAGVILMLIIVGLVFRNERIKAKSLKEKESLLKEIHHRVKNNLQVISSLLNMQSRGTEDEGMKEAIREGQSRVKAMSLIHQKLYQTENISEIDFEEYSQQLLEQLDSVYKQNDKNVLSSVDAKGISLDIDTAIPLGLILNELISNAYKYAFEGVDKGQLKISLERKANKELQLEVADNGKGLPANFSIETARSLGLKLVNILTKQLKGTLEVEQEGGTRFLIRFSELNPKAA